MTEKPNYNCELCDVHSNCGEHTEYTTRELLQEYGDLYFRTRTHLVTTEVVEQRMQEIIKELEV